MKTVIRKVEHNGNIYMVIEYTRKNSKTQYAVEVNGERSYMLFSKIGALLTMDDLIEHNRIYNG